MVETKPTKLPEWASSESEGVGGNAEEPGAGKKLTGWTDEKPPYQYFNWLSKKAYDWFKWINDVFADSAGTDLVISRIVNVDSIKEKTTNNGIAVISDLVVDKEKSLKDGTNESQFGLLTGRKTDLTTSQTWNIPSGVTFLIIDAIAGGGSGGDASTSASGGGGGCGAGISGYKIPIDTATTVIVTIGSGGAGGSEQDGSDTVIAVNNTVPVEITLPGGKSGGVTATIDGGLGGASHIVGNTGEDGASGDPENGGDGARSFLGGIAAGGIGGNDGDDATGYGTGGGGGGITAAFGFDGGAGADGLVRIWY